MYWVIYFLTLVKIKLEKFRFMLESCHKGVCSTWQVAYQFLEKFTLTGFVYEVKKNPKMYEGYHVRFFATP